MKDTNDDIFYENLAEVNCRYSCEFKEAFAELLESGWYILGKNVADFEKQFSDFNGSAFTVGLASGLDALHLALASLGLNDGDEVIVPSNTYIATILAIINNGLIPKLVEPEIETYNIDPALIEKAITKKTKAIMVVHLYGKSCDMAQITAVATKYKLPLIEDCAQAHGTGFRGTNVGNFGDFGAFSFYPTKNLGALGDAGALTMKTENNAERIKTLRNYGSKKKYLNEIQGYNSRLDELQAMFLKIKLKYLGEVIDHKRLLAELYLEQISKSFITPVVDSDYYDTYHIFNIRHQERDKLQAYLAENGVSTDIHYPVPPNKQVALKKMFDGSFPISEEIHRTTLSLPISYATKVDEVKKICLLLNRY